MKRLLNVTLGVVGILVPIVGAAAVNVGGWAAQAGVLFVLYFLAGAFLLAPADRWSRWRLALLVVPGLLLLGGPIIISRLGYVYPLLAIPLVAAFSGRGLHALLADRSRVLRITVLHGAAAVLTSLAVVGMLNWLNFYFVPPIKPFAAPPFTFYDGEGRAITRESLKGRTVVLDFWTTSCAVCYRKFPDLQKVQDRFRQRADVAVLAVHLREQQETSDYPRRFFQASAFDFPRVWTVETRRMMRQFGFPTVPTVVVIDPAGNVVFRGSGLISGPFIFVHDLGGVVERVAGASER
ncbi:MAG TPA: TlpA disulfide reductase family protein [Thermoanaerobaculia bacterium]|nr:TlpA disulfide reductase family protein [Thermoanaerobaculia bacterium]